MAFWILQSALTTGVPAQRLSQDDIVGQPFNRGLIVRIDHGFLLHSPQTSQPTLQRLDK